MPGESNATVLVPLSVSYYAFNCVLVH